MADLTGITRVVDVSHHQDGIDVGKLPVDGVIARTAQAKGGEYDTTIDRMYPAHKANAKLAGKLFASYFYLGTGLTPKQNAQLHASCEPDRRVPLMLDWERGSGDGAFLRRCHQAFRDEGYFVFGTYAPRWYWSSQGSPDLSGLPPLVSSRYADTTPGGFEDEYRSTPEAYWGGYGNNSVRLLQFTSVGRLAPYSGRNLDLNAFKGTRQQLSDWWNPNTPNPAPNPADLKPDGVELLERIHVVPTDGNTHNIRINSLPGTPGAAVIIRRRVADGTEWPMWIGHIVAWGSDITYVGNDPKAMNPPRNPKVLGDRRYDLPGALWCDLEYSAGEPFDIDVVG